MFSYLLMICGLFGLAVGGVVIYGAFADGAATTTGLPLSALVLGVTAAVANGITIAAGVLGRAASLLLNIHCFEKAYAVPPRFWL